MAPAPKRETNIYKIIQHGVSEGLVEKDGAAGGAIQPGRELDRR